MEPDLDSTYAPRSPDLSADEPEQQPHPQHQQYRGSVSHISPFVTPTDSKATFNFPPSASVVAQPFSNPSAPFFGGPPNQSPHYGVMKQEPNYEEEDEYQSSKAKAIPRKRVKAENANQLNGSGPIFAEGIEVRTKFPVARIKRIMQADEDVGKVAQVTPVAVCKISSLYTTRIKQLANTSISQQKHSSSS
jgi:hypothetical protein